MLCFLIYNHLFNRLNLLLQILRNVNTYSIKHSFQPIIVWFIIILNVSSTLIPINKRQRTEITILCPFFIICFLHCLAVLGGLHHHIQFDPTPYKSYRSAVQFQPLFEYCIEYTKLLLLCVASVSPWRVDHIHT